MSQQEMRIIESKQAHQMRIIESKQAHQMS